MRFAAPRPGRTRAQQMGDDPLYHDDHARERLIADPPLATVLKRLHWLKIASGFIALGIIAAIWIVWRWHGMR